MCGGCCGSRAGGAGGAVDGRVANGVRDHLGSLVGVVRRQLTLDYIGLNHLGWVRGASVGGNDVWPELLGAIVAEGDVGGFDPSLIELLGMLPSSYLRYYYHHRAMVEQARTSDRTRGEEVQAIESELLKMYEDEHLCTKPKLLEKRGAYYSTLAVAVIPAIVNDTRELFIVNTRNRGAIPNMPDDVVVEVPCIVEATGALPLPTGVLWAKDRPAGSDREGVRAPRGRGGRAWRPSRGDAGDAGTSARARLRGGGRNA